MHAAAVHFQSSLISIKIAAIDSNDHSFFFTPANDFFKNQELIDDIERYGIVHPPLLLQKDSDAYTILGGFRKIHAIKQLKKETAIFCHVLKNDTPLPVVYDILLHHRLPTQEFSIVEKALFLRAVQENCGQKQALKFLSRLGFKKGNKVLSQVLSLLHLETSALILLHQGKVHNRTAFTLLNFPADDQLKLAEIITQYHLGGSKQHKLVEYCQELTMRRGESVRQIIKRWEENTKKTEKGNKPQEFAHLLSWLHSECFPSSVQAEEAFRKFTASLSLPREIRIAHTPFFEDDKMTITIECLSTEQCRQLVENVNDKLKISGSSRQ